jgi:hypothetical protein
MNILEMILNAINYNSTVEGGGTPTPTATPSGPAGDGATQTGEGTGEPVTQIQTPNQTPIKFGNIEVNPNDPASIAKAADSYRSLQGEFTKNREALKQYESNNAQQTTNNQNNQSQQADDRVEFMYNATLTNSFESIVTKELGRLENKYGEDFKAAKPMLDTMLKNARTENRHKESVIKEGGLDNLFKYALKETLYNTKYNPQQVVQNNPNIVQQMAQTPEVQNAVIANQLNQYQNGEQMPPVMPNAVQTVPNIENGPVVAKTFGDAAKMAKASRLQRANAQNQGLNRR